MHNVNTINMKKIILPTLFMILSLVISIPAMATVVTITSVSTPSEGFSPNSFTISCGDTVAWVNGNGIHTTASTSVPSGASTWTSGDLNSTPYYYIPTVAGTYNYTCHPTSGGGHMDASFTVTCVAGVEDYNLKSISVYPNPSSTGFFHLTGFPIAAGIKVFDQLGRMVTLPSSNAPWLDLQEKEDGIYFIHVEYEGEQVIRRIIKY